MTFIGRQSTDQQLINHFYITGHDSYRIPQNNGYYAVQVHSMSLILATHSFIALLFDKSLATGRFPSGFKNAVVRPRGVARNLFWEGITFDQSALSHNDNGFF